MGCGPLYFRRRSNKLLRCKDSKVKHNVDSQEGIKGKQSLETRVRIKLGKQLLRTKRVGVVHLTLRSRDKS